MKTRQFPLRSAVRLSATLFLAPLLFAGCGNGEPAQAQRPGGGPGRSGGSTQQPAVNVAVEAAHRGVIASSYAATATLEAEKEAEVLARASGVVRSIVREEGDEVDAGGVLLEIENDEYRLRLLQATAERENLQAKYERLLPMVERNLVSQEEFELTRSQLASAEAEEELARLNLSYTSVRAPFAGHVVRRLVDPGQNISVGTPLFLLADFHPLLARIHVPSKEFRKLQADQEVRLVLDSDGTALRGRITLVSPTIDPATGTIKLTIEIDDAPADTRPGDFAQVEVVTERHENALLIQRNAVISEQGEDAVFVAEGDVARRRVIRVGFSNASDAEVLEGLREGELVVVRGQRSLEDGVPLRVLTDDPSR